MSWRAITDRANRLICASSAFQEWFGTSAPPRLAVDDGSADLLGMVWNELGDILAMQGIFPPRG